ncbi:5-oxoprolinase subunit B family protein [Nocardioides marmoraquaticus]
MRWRACGDAAALVDLDDLDTVLRLHAAVRDAHDDLPGLVDVVPGARSLLLRCRDRAAVERVAATVDGLDLPGSAADHEGEVVVAVTYDGEDLADVAEHLGCDPTEVVRRHLATTWRVAFTGFAPGFGYLVPERPGGSLAVPRRPESRTRVPAGAVGLAGEFSGVYPRESPGGWQLLGRTDAVLWDADRDPPALLVPGTRVRFEEAT